MRIQQPAPWTNLSLPPVHSCQTTDNIKTSQHCSPDTFQSNISYTDVLLLHYTYSPSEKLTYRMRYWFSIFSIFFFRQRFSRSWPRSSEIPRAFGWVQYSAFCETGNNLVPAKPKESGLSPHFCWHFPKVGWSEILGLLFWLSCMPVASQAQPVIISFVKARYYRWSTICSRP